MEGDSKGGSRSISGVLIAEGLPVKTQHHYYELSLLRKGASYLTISRDTVRDYGNDNLGLLKALGISLTDWRKPFSEQNKANANQVAQSDVTVSITKNGTAATADFYKGTVGVYELTVQAISTADKGNNVPFGGQASLSVPVLVGNPREAARKTLWEKLKEVLSKLEDKAHLSALSNSERTSFKQEAQRAAESAHDAIKTTGVTTIEAELRKGVEALEQVLAKAELLNAKHMAAKRVKDAQQKADDLIKQHMSGSHRSEALAKIAATASGALTAIDSAASADEAERHAADGVRGIDAALLELFKLWAADQLRAYAGEHGQSRKKLNELLKPGGGLTQAQLEAYLKQVQEIVNRATGPGGSIDQATTVDAVLEALRKAKMEIDAVVSTAQQASRAAQVKPETRAPRREDKPTKGLAATGASLAGVALFGALLAVAGLVMIRRRRD